MEKDAIGRIHIYCGDGKGKTTAALGLGLRACGRGKQVLLTQFLKGENSGERMVLKNICGFTLTECPQKMKFTFAMSAEEKQAEAKHCEELLEESFRNAQAGKCDLLILDEIFGAVSCGMINGEHLLAFIKNKPAPLELVLTGRNPGEEITALADYVTEMKKIKHPYELGVPAREGIEY